MSTKGIYGLSGSGMDIDSLVKVGMLSKQNEYDKMYKNEVKQGWIKEAYATTYNTLNTYRSSTLYDYRMSATFQPQLAEPGDSTVTTAVANANAAAMTHTVTVNKVATNAYLQSTADGIKFENTNAKKSTYIKDILGNATTEIKAVGPDGKPLTNPNGSPQMIKVSSAEDDYRKKLAGLSSDADAYAKLQNTVALSFTLSSGALYTGVATNGTDGKTTTDSSSTYNGDAVNKVAITFTYKELYEDNQTLYDLVSKINTAVDSANKENADLGNGKLGISASFDATNNSFSLYQKTGGADNKLFLSVANIENGKATDPNVKDLVLGGHTEIADDADTLAAKLLTNLNLGAVLEDAANPGQKKQGQAISFADPGDASNTKKAASNLALSGTDGEAIIDGKTYKTTTDKISASNVTYTLKRAGTTTVSVSQDTDKIIANVKKFVEDYNKIIDDLNTKYAEKQYRDYQPLTQSQEKAMTQDQIDKWNEKAKAGLLYHNKSLGKIISGMREALYTPVTSVSGSYNTMMSIGISSSNNQGHIKLDEDKLKKALAAEPNSVAEIMNSSGDVKKTLADGSKATSTDYNAQGVTGRINDMLVANLKEMKSYAGTSTENADGSTLGTLILKLKEKMSTFQSQMTAFEDALYKKYDAMETAIQRLGVSMGYITGGQ